MKVLSVKTIVVPDNDNHQPVVIPMPAQTFEGIMTPEGHAEMLRMIAEAEDDAEQQAGK